MRMTTRTAGTVAGVVVALSALVRFGVTRSGNPDDFFILLIYIRHFLKSGSFYYNASDGPVDGFTSPLDLLLKSAATALLPGRDPIAIICWVTILFHIGCALVAFLLAWRLATRLQIGRPLVHGLLIGLTIATCPALNDGASFLLETPLFTFIGLLLSATVVIAQPTTISELLLFAGGLVALSLARPEGLPLACVFLLLFLWRSGELPAHKRLIPAIAFGVVMAGYYAWHVREFGYWAPNSYYAKTSASRWREIVDGFTYVLQYGFHGHGFRAMGAAAGIPGFLVLTLGSLIVLSSRWSGPDVRLMYATLFILSWLALGAVVWEGGDEYPGGRFLALPIALSTLSLTVGFGGLTGWAKSAAAIALASIVAVQSVVVLGFALIQPRRCGQRLAEALPWSTELFAWDRAVGRAFESAGVGGASIGHTDYQRLKYFADDLHVIDLTGINDRAIAHVPMRGRVGSGKNDASTRLGLTPEIVIAGWKVYEPKDEPLARMSILEAAARPDVVHTYIADMPGERLAAVADRYTTASLPIHTAGGRTQYFDFLVRRDFGAVLREHGILVAR